MLKRTDYLTKRYGVDDGWSIERYERDGGYKQARRAMRMKREDIVEEVKKANLRGRGGAGFPMGVKWGFMPPKGDKPHYLVVNADEGEPCTFKDRTLMEQDPHATIEGCIIACRAMGAHTAYIYVRDELHLSKARLWQAIAEAHKRGYLGKRPFGLDYEVEVYVHTGAGAYICGEETALLNSLEGKRGEPRLKPPFPAQAGAFGMPTTVNNLESIAAVPVIMELGGDNFSKLSSLHGRRDGGCELLGVIPGGSSTPILRPHETVDAAAEDHPLHEWHGQSVLDVPMGVDTMRGLGTMLGTCCAIVLSDKACPVRAMHNLMRFYRHESCGQCTPCREGSAWIERILDRVVAGEAEMEELDRLHEIAGNIMGNTICAFGEGTAMPALGFLQKFRREFEEYVRSGGKSSSGGLAL